MTGGYEDNFVFVPYLNSFTFSGETSTSISTDDFNFRLSSSQSSISVSEWSDECLIEPSSPKPELKQMELFDGF